MNKKSFHLRWNNHLQNIQNLFENLYNEQSLVDVTISCSDGTLYAHKLVLSACSPYFEKVFKENPCKHPTIILKGINAREMQIILQYMYVGAVDVEEEELELLLDTATELQVKGLIQTSGDSSHTSEQQKPQKMSNSPKESYSRAGSSSPSPHYSNGDDLRWQAELVAKPPTNKNKETNLKRKHDEGKQIKEEDVDAESTIKIKVEPIDTNQEMKRLAHGNEEYQDADEDCKDYFEGLDSLERTQEDVKMGLDGEMSRPDNEDAVYFCHICIRSFQNKGSYHRHMLTHAGVKPHSCTFCEQSFLRLSHLQRHIRVHTGERPYQCTRCPKQFARSDKLRQHYMLQHTAEAGVRVSKPRGRPRKNPNSYGPPMGSLDPVVYPVMSGISPTINSGPVPVTNPV